MTFKDLLKKVNFIGRITNLEKSNAVQAASTRPYGEFSRFEATQKLPVPYYHQLRFLAKRNTSLRTILHILQDKILERDPEFIPAFVSKCMECGKEFENQTETCDCGGMTRDPDQGQLEHIKDFFKDCNDNDQSFKAVLHECEDNLNVLDDAFLLVLKEYHFDANNNLDYARIREILSADPEWFVFDMDDKMRQGREHWTCVEHRTISDEPGVCGECGKPLFPVWYIYDEGSKPMPYLKDEVIHQSRYSPSKTHGYPPVATVFEEAMIELNGNILLNDTYREQRPPKGILAIVTKNLPSLQKFWQKEMEQVQINPNHMPVMGIESDTGRGAATYTALLNSVADMDVLNVSERMRESISGLYRISPLYRGSTDGVGGLNSEDVQRAVTAEPVAAAHHGYHDSVFPKLLAMFGITDWLLEFPSPYPANDDADLDKRMKEVQIASQMHAMGFQVRLDEETSELIYSGESQAAQPEMGGFGGEDDDFGDEGGYQDELLLGKELQKGEKTYIDSPDDAPKGAKVQRGPKGGLFYEAAGGEQEQKKPSAVKNWETVDDVEELEGKPGMYFRVEAYGGAETKVGEMRSVIGADQIDTECASCGAKMDLSDLDAGCPECGAEASQDNKYAKMIDDFDLLPNEEGDYILPGLLAFENHSAAYEYAQNVPGGEIVAYHGDELYYGMQEPDTDWDEFLINPKTRFRDASETEMNKSDSNLWNILGRPLEKARKYIPDPSKAPKGVKVQRGKKGGYFYDAAPVRTSLKAQPEKIRTAVKDMYEAHLKESAERRVRRQGGDVADIIERNRSHGIGDEDAKMMAEELEEKHGIKVHPKTVRTFLEGEGTASKREPQRQTVSRKDVAEREQTISEQAKQIEDMGGKIETLTDDVKFYKDKYADLTQKNTEMELQIANLTAAVDALKTPMSGSETEGGREAAKPEPQKETTTP